MAGHLFIVAAPSGAGKTTLTRKLLEHDPSIHLSISYTTRAPRPGEQDGREYNFVDIATFSAMRERGEFIEWAEVHGNFYGTSAAWIERELSADRDVLLEIDWQGAQQVRELFPVALGIFIMPPSVEELERRLTGRGQDSAATIARRVAAAQEEMRHVGEFDYVIINDDLQTAFADLLAVVRAARLEYDCQCDRHASLFASLL
jgi:guanylate kinase